MFQDYMLAGATEEHHEPIRSGDVSKTIFVNKQTSELYAIYQLISCMKWANIEPSEQFQPGDVS